MSNSNARLKLLEIIEQAAAAAEVGAVADAAQPETRSGWPALSKTAAAPPAPPSQRTVMQLRPRPALFVDGSLMVADAAKKMASANTDAALVVTATGQLEGIMTDTDVTRKVLACQANPSKVKVASVMTTTPNVVSESDTAFHALSLMVGGRFRHLPVVNASGSSVIGVLDVAKCLFDAISRIETSELPGGSDSLAQLLAAPPPTAVATPAVTPQGSPRASPDKMAAVPPPMASLSPAYVSPDAASLVVAIRPTASVADAAVAMAARRGAVLVDDAPARSTQAASKKPLAGILTPKDLLFRVVAGGLSPTSTPVSAVMTPTPDSMQASATVLEALHQLQGSGYRQLPVVSSANAEPVGVVDVLTLIQGALLSTSAAPSHATPVKSLGYPVAPITTTEAEVDGSVEPPRSPFVCVTPADGADGGTVAGGGDATQLPAAVPSKTFAFKVSTSDGITVRLTLPVEIGALTAAVQAKQLGPTAGTTLLLSYVDAEGDKVTLLSDVELSEAVAWARREGQDRLALDATFRSPATRPLFSSATAASVLLVVTIGAVAAVALSRRA